MPGILCVLALIFSLVPAVPLRAEGLEIPGEVLEESAEEAEIVAADSEGAAGENYTDTVSGSDAENVEIPDGTGEPEDTDTEGNVEIVANGEAADGTEETGNTDNAANGEEENQQDTPQNTETEGSSQETGIGGAGDGDDTENPDGQPDTDNEAAEQPDEDESDGAVDDGNVTDTDNSDTQPDQGEHQSDTDEKDTGEPPSGTDETENAPSTVSGNDLTDTGTLAFRLPVMLLGTPAPYTDAEGNVFTYTLDDEGNATITGITLSGASLTIPTSIAGASVIAVDGDKTCVVTNPEVKIPYLMIDCETVGIRAFAGLDIGTLVLGEHLGRFTYYDAATYQYIWGQFAGAKIDSLVLNSVELQTGLAATSSSESVLAPFSGATIGALEIGSSVELIPESFLRNAVMELDSLVLNAERIGAYAFSGSNITIHELVIGTGVKYFVEYSNSLNYKHYWCQFLNATIGTLKLYAPDADLSYWQTKGLTNEVYGPFCQAHVGTLVIGEDVESIPDFFLCNATMSLDDFTLNTPKIGASAFAGANIRFGTLTIGKDVAEYPESYYSTDINHFWRQFAGCRIGKLVYGADRATVVNNVGSLDGTLFSLYGPFENAVISDLSIQDNVVRLSDYLFYNASMELEELELKVPVVGGMAFMGSNIHIVKLTVTGDVTAFALAPHSNTTYSHWEQFSQATIGEVVYLPASLNISAADVYIGYGYGPFRLAKVGKLTLGAQVTDIPAYCFKEMVLTQESLVIHAKTIGNAAFQGANISIGTLTVGEELEQFRYITSGSLNYFRQFMDTTIGTLKYNPPNAKTASECFAGIFENAKISAVEMGGTVAAVPNFLFYNAKLDLSEFTLNVPAIGYQSFHSRNNRIGELTIGADVTTFLVNSSGNSQAFDYCTINSLKYKAVSAQLEKLSGISIYGPFADSCVVNGLFIDDTVKVIPYGCFKGAKMDIGELTIENAAIGYAAFYGSNIRIGTLNIGKGASYTGVVSGRLNNFAYAKIGTLNYNSNSVDPRWTTATTGRGMFNLSVIGQLNIGADVETIPAGWFYEATLTQDTLTVPCAWGYYAFYGNKKNIGKLILTGNFDEIPCLGNQNAGFSSGTIGTVVYDVPAAVYGAADSAQTRSIFESTKVTDLVIGEHVEYLDNMLFRGMAVENCSVYPVTAKESHKLQNFSQGYLPSCETLSIHYNSDFKPYFEAGAADESWMCVDYYDRFYGGRIYDEDTGTYSVEVLNTCSICGHTETGTEEADMTYDLYLSIPLDIPLSFDADNKAYSGSAEVYAYGRLGNAYEGIRLVADTDSENFGAARLGGNTYDVTEYLTVGFTSGTQAAFDSGELSDNAGILEDGETEGLTVEQMNVSVEGIAFMQGGAGEWQISVPVKILID